MYNSLAAIEPYLNLDVPLEELAAGPDVAIEVGGFFRCPVLIVLQKS